MEQIVLEKVKIRNSEIDYSFSMSSGLEQYFVSREHYYIQIKINDQMMNLERCPESIAAVPFVCNVLPIVWLTDSELILEELDEDFFNSIPEFKKGYIEMYPDACFEGRITVNKIVRNEQKKANGSGVFFSAGLDAYCTLTRHLDESPELIALWGADIASDNVEGWEVLQSVLVEASQKYKLPLITVHSTFRKVINSGALSQKFWPVLHDEWWHAAQHGPAIIGHAAPIAWLRGYGKQYIASSFSPEDGYVTCCSYPTVDNFIRYNGCQTIHDGFELTRQDKVADVVDYCNRTGDRVQLHVCWVKQDGKNCCRCEKCMRTIAELWSVGADPHEYGFDYTKDLYSHMKEYMTEVFDYNPWVKRYWIQIQKSFVVNKKALISMGIYAKVSWIAKFDFDNPERYWKRRWNRMMKSIRSILGRIKRKLS